MIHFYGFSSVGSSHSNKGVGCQDANNCVSIGTGWVVAAVADGVGSCKYSNVAASIAVDVSVRVCVDEITKNGDTCDLLKLIENAFTQAENAIVDRSLSEDHLITDYDTTLSLVIYDGRHVTYGHSGDGGIIGLTVEGDYVKITSPQKSEGIYVVPLRAGRDKWVIDCAKEEFASVLLATDGVYDVFFPYLLKGQPVEVYVPVIRYFMDNNILKASAKTIDAIGKARKDYLDSATCSSIIDDKTVLVLINENVLPKLKDENYYAEPDWTTLQLEWNKKAYPHLYKENKQDEPKDVDGKDESDRQDGVDGQDEPKDVDGKGEVDGVDGQDGSDGKEKYRALKQSLSLKLRRVKKYALK